MSGYSLLSHLPLRRLTRPDFGGGFAQKSTFGAAPRPAFGQTGFGAAPRPAAGFAAQRLSLNRSIRSLFAVLLKSSAKTLISCLTPPLAAFGAARPAFGGGGLFATFLSFSLSSAQRSAHPSVLRSATNSHHVRAFLALFLALTP
jgi:hypothetical protein